MGEFLVIGIFKIKCLNFWVVFDFGWVVFFKNVFVMYYCYGFCDVKGDVYIVFNDDEIYMGG